MTLGVSRRQEIENAVKETLDYAVQKKVDQYNFLGDLCDWDMAGWTDAIRVAYEAAEFLARAKIHSNWLAGNHDVLEDGSNRTSLTPLRALYSTGFVNVFEAPGPHATKFVTSKKEWFDQVFFPYPATSASYDPRCLGQLEKGTHVFGHLMVAGIVPGEETSEMPRGRDVQLPVDLLGGCHVFNGHYHRRVLKGLVQIPGTLARLTFGEGENEPGFFYVEDGHTTVVRVKNPATLQTVDLKKGRRAAFPEAEFVRLRPEADVDAEDVRALEQKLAAKSVAVKVLPAPRSNPLPEKSVEPLKVLSTRGAVEQMVEEAAEDAREELRVVAQRVLAEVGL